MSVLPFAGGASRLKPPARPLAPPPPLDRQKLLRDFIDDIQLLLIHRFNVFLTIASLTHGLAEKSRRTLHARAQRETRADHEPSEGKLF